MKRAEGLNGGCTGCGACYAVCKFNAIDIAMSDKGFFTASVNEKCVYCEQCTHVCIVSQKEKRFIDFEKKSQYNVWLKNEKDHKDCASGGVAYGIYLNALKRGYKVIGTYYDTEENQAVTTTANSLEEAKKFRGSKYIQGNHVDAINKALNSNEYYVVCGTPCQVYGYYLAAKLYNCEDRFLFVDMFCHGVPSYLAWEYYIKEVTGGNEVTEVTFRDHKHGWREYYLTVKSDNNTIHSCERSKDYFYNVFYDSYLMADCCYTCEMCQRYGCSDIRIGDLWDESICQDGVFRSLVCIGTEKGRKFWNAAKESFNIENISRKLVEKNAIPDRLEIIRTQAFDDFNNGIKPLKKIIKRYRKKESFKRRLRRNKYILRIYLLMKKR